MKKQITRLSLIVCFAILTIFLFNSTNLAQTSSKTSAPDDFQQENWLTFEAEERFTLTELNAEKHRFGLSHNDDLQLIRSDTDQLGMIHHRYQQTYKGIPVEGGEWLIHEKAGIITTANGKLVRGLQLTTTPALTESEAYTIAGYLYQSDHTADIGSMVILSPEWNSSAASYRLAYKYGITTPHSSEWLYLDAQTGQIIRSQSHIRHCGETGTGTSTYYGEVPLDICFDGAKYLLKDTIRNIWTYDYALAGFSGTTEEFVHSDLDTNWTGPSEAIDIHWATARAFDYYKNVYGRNGIDNNLARLRCYFNWNSVDRAAYHHNNHKLTFGTGDSVNWTPLTSLDIVVHEFSHGVIHYTANLANNGEPGALAESFCDIFGTMVEFDAMAPDSADYLIGEDVTLAVLAIRSLADPNSLGHPDTYYGNHWLTSGTAIHHNNATVQNYWFFLLAEGGSGTNDNGIPYTVTGIGRDTAAQIAYHNLAYYLTSDAGFADARMGSLQATDALYGDTSNAYLQVLQAWCAVGVGSCLVSSDSIVVSQPNGSTVWQAGNTEFIEWENSPTIDFFRLEYSVNGGFTWLPIADNVPTAGAINSYPWTVPDVATPIARIRVMNVDDLSIVGESELFEITACVLVAGFEYADTLCLEDEPLWVEFTSTWSGADGYFWQINGNDPIHDDAVYNHPFIEAGDYEITLLVVDDVSGCHDSYTETITIESELNADFTYSTDGLEMELFALENDATDYTWTIDGIEVGAVPQLNYMVSSTGTYEVCLEVANGCEGMQVFCDNVVLADGVDGCQSWEQFTNGDNIQAIAEDGDYIWVGTRGGLVSINKIDGETVFYNNLNSGLPSNYINSIAIDNNSDKWIGTSNGLVHFDDMGWMVYDTSNSELLDNWIRVIVIESNGDKWMSTGSFDGGLAHFDGTNWMVYDTSNSELPANYINSIAIDSNDDKWIGTAHGGLAYFNGTNWMVYDTSNSELPSNNIKSIFIDNNNDKWIASSGLVQFDGSNWTVFDVSNSGLPSNNITSIFIDNNNDKWISTHTGNKLAQFDGSNWIVYDASNSDLPNSRYNIVFIDNDSHKWIGTDDKGLIHFDDINWTTFNTSNSDLPTNYINSIAIDSNDDKWMTNFDGLFHFDDDNWTVYDNTNYEPYEDNIQGIVIDSNGDKWMATIGGLAHFDGFAWSEFNTDNSGLPGFTTGAISIDSNDEIWIGTNNGLAHFDDSTWTVYDTLDLPSNNIRAIAIDSNEEKWIGTDNGLAHFDGLNWIVYDTLDLPSNNIRAIAIDSNDEKWIGTDKGLAHFDDSTWTVYDTSTSVLPHNSVWAIAIDSNDEKWIGTIGGSIAHLDDDIWTIYNSSAYGVPAEWSITTIIIDNNGDKWFGLYLNGFVHFDGTWTLYNSSNSDLSNNSVYSIAVDSDNHKWIGTADGLVHFDDSTWTVFNNYGSGLFSNNTQTITIDGFDNKWIGAFDGLAYFDGSNWRAHTYQVNVLAVAIDNNSEAWVAAGGFWGSPGGLMHYDGHIRTGYASNLPSTIVTSIAIDSNNGKWIGTINGLAHFDDIDWVIYNLDTLGLVSNDIQAVAIDNHDHKWIGTDAGLAHFNDTTWVVYTVSNSELPHNNIRTIIVDSNNGKWIGTVNGLAHFDGMNWTVYHTSNSGLPSNSIHSIAEDSNGTKWIATSGGIGILSNTTTSFTIPPTTTCPPATLTFQNTSSGSNSTYTWQVNGPTIDTSITTPDSLTHTFTTPGKYAITLLGDNGNCTDQHTEIVSIYPEVSTWDMPTTWHDCTDSITVDAGWGYASYAWSNGDTTQTITVSGWGDYGITVTDYCSGTDSAMVSVLADGHCVWPGDLNADSVVNQLDFLYWGLYYGADGFARPDASLTWAAQPAPDWSSYQINGANLKHIDSDGNSIVDMRDTIAIAQNYGRTIDNINSSSSSSSLYLNVEEIGVEERPDTTNLVYCLVTIGNSSGGSITAHGLEFAIDYSLNLGDIEGGYVRNAYLVFDTSFLNIGGDAYFFSRYLPESSTIVGAITKIDQINVTGNGITAILIVEVADEDVSIIDDVEFDWHPQSANIMTSNGNLQPLNMGSSASFLFTPVPPTHLHLKVFLEGAYDAGECLMNTTLFEEGLLPLEQPYHLAPWNYEGEESIPSIHDLPDNAIDWVLIEARSAADPDLIHESKAAILLDDGRIVGVTDGCYDHFVFIQPDNGIRFCGLEEGESYYIVVRHRNHLAVMSAEAVEVINGMLNYDFTTGVAQAFGDGQLVELAGDKYGLYAGDFDSNGIVNVEDFNFYVSQAATVNDYLDSDCNLDSHITVSDENFYFQNATLIGIDQIRY